MRVCFKPSEVQPKCLYAKKCQVSAITAAKTIKLWCLTYVSISCTTAKLHPRTYEIYGTGYQIVVLQWNEAVALHKNIALWCQQTECSKCKHYLLVFKQQTGLFSINFFHFILVDIILLKIQWIVVMILLKCLPCNLHYQFSLENACYWVWRWSRKETAVSHVAMLKAAKHIPIEVIEIIMKTSLAILQHREEMDFIFLPSVKN